MMNLSRNDILEALGLQQRGPEAWIGPLLAGFGAGALVGVTLAMLLTPRTGSELRSEILERGRRVVRRGREGIDEIIGEQNGGTAPENH